MPTLQLCTLAETETKTAATGKTSLLKARKTATWPTEETLKDNVRIEVYKSNKQRAIFN